MVHVQTGANQALCSATHRPPDAVLHTLGVVRARSFMEAPSIPGLCVDYIGALERSSKSKTELSLRSWASFSSSASCSMRAIFPGSVVSTIRTKGKDCFRWDHPVSCLVFLAHCWRQVHVMPEARAWCWVYKGLLGLRKVPPSLPGLQPE